MLRVESLECSYAVCVLDIDALLSKPHLAQLQIKTWSQHNPCAFMVGRNGGEVSSDMWCGHLHQLVFAVL